jgi:hypothetical protein
MLMDDTFAASAAVLGAPYIYVCVCVCMYVCACMAQMNINLNMHACIQMLAWIRRRRYITIKARFEHKHACTHAFKYAHACMCMQFRRCICKYNRLMQGRVWGFLRRTMILIDFQGPFGQALGFGVILQPSCRTHQR